MVCLDVLCHNLTQAAVVLCREVGLVDVLVFLTPIGDFGSLCHVLISKLRKLLAECSVLHQW